MSLKKASTPPHRGLLVSIAESLLWLILWILVFHVFVHHLDVLLALLSVMGAALWIWEWGGARHARRVGKAPGGAKAPARSSSALSLHLRHLSPLAFFLLLWHSIGIAPFRIPTDSMMPTLYDGDIILVDQSAYGLRMFGHKIIQVDEPRRGDVVVFHPPFRPSQYWVKRVVGLPGDRIVIDDDRLTVNGTPIGLHIIGRYSKDCYENMRIARERLGKSRHNVLLCPKALQVLPPQTSCERTDSQTLLCARTVKYPQLPDRRNAVLTVPPGEYLMIGDNRDNSLDGRYWGFVPEKDLVGKAIEVLFHLNLATNVPLRITRIWIPIH